VLAAAGALVVAALEATLAADPLAVDAEDAEAGALVVALLLPVVEDPLEDAVPKGVLAAPGAQVAAMGRLVTDWPAQRASAKVMVAVLHILASVSITPRSSFPKRVASAQGVESRSRRTVLVRSIAVRAHAARQIG